MVALVRTALHAKIKGIKSNKIEINIDKNPSVVYNVSQEGFSMKKEAENKYSVFIKAFIIEAIITAVGV